MTLEVDISASYIIFLGLDRFYRLPNSMLPQEMDYARDLGNLEVVNHASSQRITIFVCAYLRHGAGVVGFHGNSSAISITGSKENQAARLVRTRWSSVKGVWAARARTRRALTGRARTTSLATSISSFIDATLHNYVTSRARRAVQPSPQIFLHAMAETCPSGAPRSAGRGMT